MRRFAFDAAWVKIPRVELDARQREMLDTALAKARKLVADLERQQDELEAAPPAQHQQLTPEQLAQGKQAMANALAAARRMLKALEDAEAIAND